MSDRIRVDVAFAMVPEWLLTAASSRAVHLFAVLARHADGDWRAKPRRKTLASWLRCSTKSVDRALEELIEVGAVTREYRFEEGFQEANLYTLHFGNPSGATPVSPGGDTRDASDAGVPPITREVPLPLSESVRSGSSVEENPALRGDLEGPSTTGALTAQDATASFVDRYAALTGGLRPSPRTIGAVAQQAGQLLSNGASLEEFNAGVELMLQKQKLIPSLLPQFVDEARLPLQTFKNGAQRFGRGVTVADGIARTQSALDNGR